MHQESEAPCFAMGGPSIFRVHLPRWSTASSTACESLLMLRSRVIVYSMTTSRARSTSSFFDSTLRPYMPCHGKEQRRPLSFLQFMKMAVRENCDTLTRNFSGKWWNAAYPLDSMRMSAVAWRSVAWRRVASRRGGAAGGGAWWVVWACGRVSGCVCAGVWCVGVGIIPKKTKNKNIQKKQRQKKRKEKKKDTKKKKKEKKQKNRKKNSKDKMKKKRNKKKEKKKQRKKDKQKKEQKQEQKKT